MQTVLDLYLSAGFVAPRVGSKHGGEYAGPCPFCASGRDRFRLWPEDSCGGTGGGYWCRVCRAKGDAIQFLRDYHGLGFAEAKARLGLPVTALQPREGVVAAPAVRAWEPKAWPLPSLAWQRKARAFVEACERELWQRHPAVVEWLRGARGISAATVRAFRLGWNPKDQYRQREGWGLPTIITDKGKPTKLFLPEGVVIPFFQPGEQGEVLVRVKVRRPAPDKGPEFARDKRYWQIAMNEGSGQGTWLIRRGDADPRAVMAVETELDGLLVAQAAGDLVGVIPLGSASMRPDASVTPLLRRADIVLDALDYDAAGVEHGKFWSRNFPRNYRRHPVPEGKDIGDAFAAGWDIRAWVAAGLPRSMWPDEFLANEAEGAPATAPDAWPAPDIVPVVVAGSPAADRAEATAPSLVPPVDPAVPARPFTLAELLEDQPASVRRLCEMVRACGDRIALISSASGHWAMRCGAGDRECERRPSCAYRQELHALFSRDAACDGFVHRLAQLGRRPAGVVALSSALAACPAGAWVGGDLLLRGCEACATWDCARMERIIELVWELNEDERRWIEARGGLR